MDGAVRAPRLALVLVGAFAFGVAAGAFKGDGAVWRGQIGNLSAPWLLVGLAAALSARRLLTGAMLGMAATLVALAGFYLALTVVLAGDLGGGGLVRELGVEVSANRVYFVAGLVSGPVMGAFGAWLGAHHRNLVPAVAGALLMFEIAVVALAQGNRLAPAPLYLRWAVDSWTPYVLESIVGLAVVAVTVVARRPGDHRTE